MSLQGKGILWITKSAKKEGTVGLKAGDKSGLQSWGDTQRLTSSTTELPVRELIMQRIWLLDSPEAGGDGARSGGNAQISNSAKARGLLPPEDGNASQHVVLTLPVCVSSKKGVTSSCKLRNTAYRKFRHLRVKAAHAMAVWAPSANAFFDDNLHNLMR